MFFIAWEGWRVSNFEMVEVFTEVFMTRECLHKEKVKVTWISSPIFDKGKEKPDVRSCVRRFSSLLPHRVNLFVKE